MSRKTHWSIIGLCYLIFLTPSWTSAVEAAFFIPPVVGPIRYSLCPVNDGSQFNQDIPQTWYSTAWAGRYSEITGIRCEGTGGHPGVDIRDAYGRQNNDLGIYAIGDGIIIRKRYVSGWGNFIVVKHSGVAGYGAAYSIYAHLLNFEDFIENGVEGEILVARGQRVATMGESGGVPRHLHFQVDRTWPSSKNSPYWPKYTNRYGVRVPYPASSRLCGAQIDDCLTESQRLEASMGVMENTINPMWLVENGNVDLDWQSQFDMKDRAIKDYRFLSIRDGTFGRYLNWDPSWELRWVDSNFIGNRIVRIWHATNKANSALRYTIFFDPDTNSWTSWQQAF